MSGLFGSPPPPPPIILPPKVIPPPPMPDLESPAVLEAKRKQIAMLGQEQGRASTILTNPNKGQNSNPDSYGGAKLGGG